MDIIKHMTEPYWGREIMLMGSDGLSFVRIYWYTDDEKSIFIECLSVDPTARRKGIATKMLKEVHDIAKRLEAESITLSVKRDSWVFDWYKRLGFNWHTWDCQNQSTVWLMKRI